MVSLGLFSAECISLNSSWNLGQPLALSCISFSMRILYLSACLLLVIGLVLYVTVVYEFSMLQWCMYSLCYCGLFILYLTVVYVFSMLQWCMNSPCYSGLCIHYATVVYVFSMLQWHMYSLCYSGECILYVTVAYVFSML